MRVPYGLNKEYFKYSLFLVFCNRLTTSAVSAGALLVNTTLSKPEFLYLFRLILKNKNFLPLCDWYLVGEQESFRSCSSGLQIWSYISN